MPGIPLMNIKAHLLTAIRASLAAGSSILQVYNQDFTVEQKADNSPLTLADRKSHDVISTYLEPSGIPVLSEEGKSIDYANRIDWKTLWLVDPLDGTKEFIKKNGEFTVNIALIKGDAPVLGVIYVPVLAMLYFAAEDLGAYRLICKYFEDIPDINDLTLNDWIQRAVPIQIDASGVRPYTIVGSRSHATPELEAYVNARRREFHMVDFVSAGSSLKFCQVAEGSADVYPRLGPTMEWDTAAGHVIAEQAGAKVLIYNTELPLTYNKEELKNPCFIVSNGRS
jgi:3'(2'), 5'-bisphosphate nucleotidase